MTGVVFYRKTRDDFKKVVFMIDQLEKIAKKLDQASDSLGVPLSYEVLTHITYKNQRYPIYMYSLGSQKPSAPVLFVTGGVHGLEKIGVQLAWSLLKTTLDKLNWDHSLQYVLRSIRLVIVPLLNPAGYYHQMRSNGNGVDLMRNSPIIAEEKTPFLVGGQTYSNKLPWYQGNHGQMEAENLALSKAFLKETKKSQCVISIDFHSGFGLKDRLWFPFSYKPEPFDDLSAMYSLMTLFEESHPYHIYQIEPQTKGYMLNGDMWDYLFLKFKEVNAEATYIPLTLEMGSWIWVKKNPLQLFTREGVFNPVKEHRLKRTYRRHHLFFDFLLKALQSNEAWADHDTNLKAKNKKLAIKKWY